MRAFLLLPLLVLDARITGSLVAHIGYFRAPVARVWPSAYLRANIPRPRASWVYRASLASHALIKVGSPAAMYGMLLESVQHYVRLQFGEPLWEAALAELGQHNFSTHLVYPDDSMTRLADACAKRVPGWSRDTFLFFFGRCFVRFFSHYGYDKLIRASGRHLRDFLGGIDNLHHQIRFSYPRMRSPSLQLLQEHRGGALLLYRSCRRDLHFYLVGQLVQVASTFYGMRLQVRVLSQRSTPDGAQALLRLSFDNAAFTLNEQRRRRAQEGISLPDVSWGSLLRLFPFGMLVDRCMRLLWLGHRLRMVFDQGGETGACPGRPVHDLMRLHRPMVAFTWENLLTNQQVVVELECIFPEQSTLPSRRLLLKGEMRYLHESDVILFLGVPLLSGLDELQMAGLYLEDLCIHDMTRDIVLAEWQHGANLEVSYREQESKSRTLEENLVRLDAWRQRGDELLYSMIPKSVADRLRRGAHPVDTCEVCTLDKSVGSAANVFDIVFSSFYTFDSVTVLFSELVNFPMACRHLSPMQVVSWVNATFSLFDLITDRYHVFKVETVGQVYMLVSGAPERREDHAEQVCAAALEMLFSFQGKRQPFDEQGTFLRLGVHSGPVAAGVVGLKTLRYCLFGDTVNTAARMQTHGENGRIHISDSCQKLIRKKGFVTEIRGKIEVKGKGKMRTHWLLEGDVLSSAAGGGRRRISLGEMGPLTRARAKRASK
ncbi:soluble guanylate cyclase 88E-like isoform X3 [Dermacentor albipictus]|uniref:soluble guanylate cyclase 88E-like isoform X3 n=1 Tax=Dermacentor albipictus TaxID=60249 RepID=UPI0038FC87B4